jgi:hypothetical protein
LILSLSELGFQPFADQLIKIYSIPPPQPPDPEAESKKSGPSKKSRRPKTEQAQKPPAPESSQPEQPPREPAPAVIRCHKQVQLQCLGHNLLREKASSDPRVKKFKPDAWQKVRPSTKPLFPLPSSTGSNPSKKPTLAGSTTACPRTVFFWSSDSKPVVESFFYPQPQVS